MRTGAFVEMMFLEITTISFAFFICRRSNLSKTSCVIQYIRESVSSQVCYDKTKECKMSSRNVKII
jgi:hypothetical protein